MASFIASFWKKKPPGEKTVVVDSYKAVRDKLRLAMLKEDIEQHAKEMARDAKADKELAKLKRTVALARHKAKEDRLKAVAKADADAKAKKAKAKAKKAKAKAKKAKALTKAKAVADKAVTKAVTKATKNSMC